MPTDKTTPEDVEAANAVAAATEREAKAQKEIAKAIEKALALQKESRAEIQARIDLLLAAADHEGDYQETQYTYNTRNREVTAARQELMEDELNTLRKRMKAGEKMTKQEQKRFKLLDKGLAQQAKAINKVESLIEGSGDLMEDKLGGAVAVVAKIMEVSLSDKFMILHNQVSGLADKGFAKLKTAAIDLIFAFDEVTKGFEKQMQLGPEYTAQIESQYRALNDYGVSVADAAEAQTQLATQFTDFTMLSISQREELAENSAVLGQLGVAQQDFARGVQNSTKFFGQSSSAAVVTQRELMETVRALGRSPAELSAEFAAAGNSLAKFGDQGVQAFKDLSRVAKITGMEMDKVLSMTNKFDTFEGAAEQAGKLNAAMGGNMVNAMDMMMETDPAARFETLRESILNTVGSFDDMSYYQKQFYAESLGLSDVGDLAMMLSGDMDSLAGATNKSAAELIEEKERALQVKTAKENLAITMAKLAETFLPLVDYIQRFASFLARSTPLVWTLVGALTAWKVVSGILAIRQALRIAMAPTEAAANTTLAASIQAQATATAALAAAMTTEGVAAAGSTGPLLANAGATGTAGGAATGATGPFLAFAAAAVKLGLGVLAAGVGLGVLVAAFSLLSFEQMMGMSVAVGTFALAAYAAGPSFGVMATGLAALTPAAAAAAAPVAALGLAMMSLAGPIFIAAAGIGLAGAGLGYMFSQIDIPKAIAVGVLVGILAIAAPGLLAAGFGFAGVGAGMLLFGLALKMISTRDLEAMGQFAVGMSEMNVGNINALVTALRAVADAMDEIPTAKAIMLTATLDAAAIAAKASNAIVGRSSGQEGTRTQASASKQKPQPVNVHVTLELDGEVLDRRIVKTSTDARSSGGLLDTVANILN